MEKTHSESFLVRPTECDMLGRMRLDALFISMQEGGERHARGLGVGYDALMAQGLFFVLARIHVRTQRAPRNGERVIHTTWPGTFNRFFFPRYHTFALEDGTPLAQAAGLWALLDTRNRRIASPAKMQLDFPDNSDIPEPVGLPLRLPTLCKDAETFSRAPVYSEFDVNGHVNNTRYVAWLCDALGVDALCEHYVGDLTAGYEREIRGTQPLAFALSREGEAFSFLVASDTGEKHFVAGGTLRREVLP